MKRKLISVVLTLLFTVSTTFCTNYEKDPHRAAAHMIIMLKPEAPAPPVPAGFPVPSKPAAEGALCSATAIGPHALLTADHCDEGNTELFVDSRPNDDKPFKVHILGRILDNEDHLILLVDGPEFQDTTARFYNVKKTDTKIGEQVFAYGDGEGLFPPELRKGYRMGYLMIPPDAELGPTMPKYDRKVYLYDLNIIPGDSGSAVYSESDGRLVAVTTYSISGRFMGAYALRFTAQQIKQAETFPGK